MSRHERLAKRLRGAGRVAVDDGPVAFTLRNPPSGFVSSKAHNVSHDVLATVTKSEINCRTAPISPSDSDTKPSLQGNKKQAIAKLMDFRTPKAPSYRDKSMCKSHRTSGKKSSRKRICQEPSGSITSPAAPDQSLALPLVSSTPAATNFPEINGLLDVLDASHRPMSQDQMHSRSFECSPITMPSMPLIDLPPGAGNSTLAGSLAFNENAPSLDCSVALPDSVQQGSSSKRRLCQTDIQIPVQMSPSKKPRKRICGLLRELGPGASRFIIGAPNFATPARPKKENVDMRLQSGMSGSRRLSGRLEAMNVLESRGQSVRNSTHRSLNSLEEDQSRRVWSTSTRKRNMDPTSKNRKTCTSCDSSKAWGRWHPTVCGSWRCTKCHKKNIIAEKRPHGLQNNTSVAGRRGKAPRTLSDDELVLLLVRRRQGATFYAIATELKKWKTGQSVKNYLQKPETQTAIEHLSDRVESFFKEETLGRKSCQQKPSEVGFNSKKASCEGLRPTDEITKDRSMDRPGLLISNGKMRENDDLDILSS